MPEGHLAIVKVTDPKTMMQLKAGIKPLENAACSLQLPMAVFGWWTLSGTNLWKNVKNWRIRQRRVMNFGRSLP